MINCSNFCYRTTWVQANGVKYKCDVGVILCVEDDLPQVGHVQDIYLVNESQVAFHVKRFSTAFESHYRAYVLFEEKEMTELVYLNNLFVPTPVHIRTSRVLESNKYIILLHLLCTV